MAYNIDSTKTPVSDAWVLAKDVVRLMKQHEGDLPERNWLESLVNPALDAIASGEPERLVPIKDFTWSGAFSGNSLDTMKEIAKSVRGQLDVIFCWEGGDSYSGLRIQNGEVTECEVKMVLVPKAAEKA